MSSVAAAAPSETELRFRAEVAAVNAEAGDEYVRGTTAGEAGQWDEALAHYRRAAELAPTIDHPHRRMCSVLASLGRARDALGECEAALSLAPASPYNKMALATAMTQAKQDLPRALVLAKEALPALSGDPTAVGMYCTVLLDARTLPGIDAQLNDCIAHLYVLDPEGMESNYLGALVAALHGQRDLARKRLDTAKRAGLPDAEYTQLAAEIDGPPTPTPIVVAESPRKPSMVKMVTGFVAGAVGTAALILLGVRLWRRRRS